MHHYLEHTRDPRGELSAAGKVLEPGGYLMIEMPDTASPLSRRLGRFWNPWFQPQHLHFVTCANLVAELGEAGMEVLSVERGPATTGADLACASLLALQAWAPPRPRPWLPPLSPGRRAKRMAILAAGLPLLGVALTVDNVRDALLRRPGSSKPSNAFRIVARRP
jgi:Methyltransferase domain